MTISGVSAEDIRNSVEGNLRRATELAKDRKVGDIHIYCTNFSSEWLCCY